MRLHKKGPYSHLCAQERLHALPECFHAGEKSQIAPSKRPPPPLMAPLLVTPLPSMPPLLVGTRRMAVYPNRSSRLKQEELIAWELIPRRIRTLHPNRSSGPKRNLLQSHLLNRHIFHSPPPQASAPPCPESVGMGRAGTVHQKRDHHPYCEDCTAIGQWSRTVAFMLTMRKKTPPTPASAPDIDFVARTRAVR